MTRHLYCRCGRVDVKHERDVGQILRPPVCEEQVCYTCWLKTRPSADNSECPVCGGGFEGCKRCHHTGWVGLDGARVFAEEQRKDTDDRDWPRRNDAYSGPLCR